MRIRSSSSGFSLIEIIAVSAVILILLAVLLPVLVQVRKTSRRADNISRMHQLGLGAALYHDQSNDWPRGTIDLVNAKLIPTEICASTIDPSPGGQANIVGEAYSEQLRRAGFEHPSLVSNYKNSWIGLREFFTNRDAVRDWVQDSSTGGWLIDATAADTGTDRTFITAKGQYKRLRFDSSVAQRTFHDVICSTGSPCRTPIIFFVDQSDQMNQWLKSGKK